MYKRQHLFFSENLGGVVFGVDLADGVGDDSIAVYHVGRPQGSTRLLAVEFLESPGLVGLQDDACRLYTSGADTTLDSIIRDKQLIDNQTL